jgi:integrase
MKERYRLFLRRKSVYYAFDNSTKTFESLKTKDKAEATRLLLALNEAGKQPAMNLGLARVYLKHSDPMVAQRTWQHVLDEIIKLKTGPTQYRWQSAAKDKAFDLIRSRLLIETQAEHFLAVLKKGTVSTNCYLRKTHNFALDMNWLPATVIPRRQWPAIRFKDKRAITLAEHQKIIAAEVNPERKTLYQLCWHLGASQGDIAALKGEDVDWTNNTISFFRKKTGVPVLLHLGGDALNLLKDMPSEGPLFPYLSKVRAGDRATEFKQRCQQL